MSTPVIPCGQIRWIVDRMHVSMSHQEVADELRRRMTSSDWTEDRKNEAIAYAIKCHEHNRSLYNDVMSGSI